MSEDENHRAFESWITSPPYELEVSRFSANENMSAWPGPYLDDTVQLAWEAWLESCKIGTGQVALEAQTEDAWPVPQTKLK